MGGLGHLFEKLWENVKDILHGTGKASIVFHALIDILRLFEPAFAEKVSELVRQAAGFDHLSSAEKRLYVIGELAHLYPEQSSSRINLAVEVAYQLMPAKLKDWA